MPSLELLRGEAAALVRAVAEGKFGSNSHSDPEVLCSALIARCSLRLAELAQSEDEDHHGPDAARWWATWRRVGPEREEWSAALANAQEVFAGVWSAWSAETRNSAVHVLFAPLECADIELFKARFEAAANDHL